MTHLFSTEYAAIQARFHVDRPDYGTSGANYSEQVFQMAQRLQTRDILDYGCGKCTLQASLPFPIQNYDPFIQQHSARPNPADIVVCTDVMEHVEEDYVLNVLLDIYSLANKAVFFEIATGPAKKVLPDGRNAHITIKSTNWWLGQMLPYFDIKSVMDLGYGFVAVVAPRHDQGAFSPEDSGTAEA